MDETDAERLERSISELENYMLALERLAKKMDSDDRLIVGDALCLIRFFPRLCECCGGKHEYKSRSINPNNPHAGFL